MSWNEKEISCFNALPVSRVEKDPEKLKEAYEIGRKTALARLEEIRNYLGY